MGYNPKDAEIGKLCMDAIRKDAFETGFEKGFDAGVKEGHEALVANFVDASAVEKVVHVDAKTIVYFADGERETVTYDPKYGYPYDREKSVMAAMLKHVVGNRYLGYLKKFEGPNGKALTFGNYALHMSMENVAENISRDMIERLSCGVSDPDDIFDPAGTAFSPEGAVNLSEDELLLAELDEMSYDDEIDLSDYDDELGGDNAMYANAHGLESELEKDTGAVSGEFPNDDPLDPVGSDVYLNGEFIAADDADAVPEDLGQAGDDAGSDTHGMFVNDGDSDSDNDDPDAVREAIDTDDTDDQGAAGEKIFANGDDDDSDDEADNEDVDAADDTVPSTAFVNGDDD